jgi:hypothetical protein
MAAKFRTFSQNFAVRVMGTPATWSGTPQYASNAWLDVNTYRRIVYLPICGELDADITVTAYEADDAIGTGAQAIDAVNLVGTFTNGADEGLPGIVEVLTSDMSKRYINFLVTLGATDGYAGVVLLDEGTDQPEVNTVGTHVAFNARVV